MNSNLERFLASLTKMYPWKDTLSRPDLVKCANATDNQKGLRMFLADPTYKIRHGVYKNVVQTVTSNEPVSTPVSELETSAEVDLATKNVATNMKSTVIRQHIDECNLIPEKSPTFVGFGDFDLLKNIIKSKKFFPIYISGESGNGKTFMVYQACAVNKRELVRANITETTDEDDLIGGFRLLNGETVWQDGPVLEAMKRGAVLLLDEVNLASPKIMCLQPVLEGNAIFVKKINTLVAPAPGFTVIATANTKGKASADGRYIGSNTLNEAFLDRFACTMEHDYPKTEVELRILENLINENNQNTPELKDFCVRLVNWADTIRETYAAQGIDEVITTRRLIHIVNFYCFGKKNRMKAIEYCISRFDTDTKESFISLYKKIDETIKIEEEEKEVKVEVNDPDALDLDTNVPTF